MSFAAVPLSEVAEINPTAPRLAPDEEVSFLPMADARDDGTVTVSERRAYRLVKTGYTGFANDDVLIAKVTPCFENNKIVQASLPTPFGFGSTEFHVARAGDDLDSRYLLHFLRQDWVRYAGERRMTGSGGQRRVPKQFLEQLRIPKPPLPEQRRIAVILDQADALRRLRRQSLSRLSDLGQAIFFEMFGEAGSNPRGWPTMKLADLCGVGSSKRVFVSEFVESGVPFYRGTEVGQLGAGKPISPDLFISPEHYEKLILESGRPEIGDLLLPSICHDGRIWMVNDGRPFYFKDGRVLWIKSANADIDGEYLRRHLQLMFLRDYSKIASGTTFAELKIVNLKSLQILYPPLDLQRQFAKRMSSLERARKSLLGAVNMVESLFSSLQHRAFRGEL